MTSTDETHRILIVGGGAGGLELATRLGNTLGRRKVATVILVDAFLTHVWKPLLHELAAGTFHSHNDRVEFLTQARDHHFRFCLGRMERLDRQRRLVHLAPVLEGQDKELLPRRFIGYDILVLAVGSVANDYGIPGVQEHCLHLDDSKQAEHFHHLLLHYGLRAQYQKDPIQPGKFNIAIIGAGATGVELTAELHYALCRMVTFGMDHISPERDVRLVLVEAGKEILPSLPTRVAKDTREELLRLGVEIRTGEPVQAVSSDGLHFPGGRFLGAQMKVWTAGIKAPDFLKDLDGLETNRLNQLVVHETLQSTRDEDVFAIGDCACIPQRNNERPVPPRAQAAHQQASLLARSLERRLKGAPLLPYEYKDYGSLISLSRYTAIGNLMGNLMGSLTIEGRLARLVYRSLYRMHQLALHGAIRTVFLMLTDLVARSTRPRLKLH